MLWEIGELAEHLIFAMDISGAVRVRWDMLAANQPTELVALTEAAARYAADARSSNTQRAYEQQFRYFSDWCRQNGQQSLPAAPETVALYLAARAQAGIKVASLSLALAAISQMHELLGQPSPRGSSIVREVFKGVRRTHGTVQTQKPPVLVDDLRSMLAGASARDRALVLLGWAGAFRRSELVGLQVGDVSFLTQGMVVTLRRSKTDQNGLGRQVAISHAKDPELCPVSAVRAWLSQLDVTACHSPLFRSVDRHGNIGGALDGKDVARLLKRLGGSQFSGHSLRAGLVTSAARAGVSARSIAGTTGHKSTAMVAKYIRAAEMFNDCPAARLL